MGQTTPQVQQFLSQRHLPANQRTINNLLELVSKVGWEQAAELTDQGRSKGASFPIGWALGLLRNQARWAAAKQQRSKPSASQTRQQQIDELFAKVQAMRAARAEKAEACRA